MGTQHPDYAKSLNNLAVLMAATNRPQEALQLMHEAATIETKILGQIFSVSSDTQRLNYLQQNRGNLYAFLSLVTQYLPADADAARSAFDILMQRKALATEAATLQRLLILSDRYQHLAPQLEQLRQIDTRIAYVSLHVPPPEILWLNCTSSEKRSTSKSAGRFPK